MNMHTTDWPVGQDPKHALADELRSPGPGLLDAILEPLTKPRRDDDNRAILPSATVVMTPDGSPIRSVLTGRSVRVTGFYVSRKAGRALPYEGMNELALLKRSEVDTSVIDYRSQPIRFEFVINGAKRVYIADCVRLLDNGTVEVIEVKNCVQQFSSPEYAEKLAAVRDVCESLGWRFRALARQQLFKPHVVYANIDLIQSRRMVQFEQVHAYQAMELLERGAGETTLGDLSEILGGGPRGVAISQAMMVRRLVAIDMNGLLTAESKVAAVSSWSFAGRVA
jgi:hypothetical protein